MTAFDTSETDRLLTTTRAVRRRLDLERPVAPQVVLECLELAHQAPIASNHEVRRWVVVTEQPIKDRLAELYRVAAIPYLRDMSETEGDPAQQRVGESALHLAENLERVPVLVVACLDERLDLTSNEGAAASYGSVMPAIWSFQLALRSRGLGSAWTTLHLPQERESAELLGIPEDVAQLALLPVAYTLGTDFKPARRTPVTELTYWNRWGATQAPEPPPGTRP